MTNESGKQSKTRTHDSVLSFPSLPSSRSKGLLWGWKPLSDGEVRALIPCDLPDLIANSSRSFRDNTMMMFSLIAGRWFNGRCDNDAHTSIHRDTFRVLFGDNYGKCLRFLEGNRFIAVDHSYQAGNKTKRYRPRLHVLRPVTIRNKPLAKKFHAMRRQKTQEAIGRAKDMNWETSVRWMIDVIETRMNFMADNAIEVLKEMDPVTDKQWLQYHYAELSAEALMDRRLVFHLDKRTGRFFTNITNLPKEFRQFVRLDMEPLVDVDVVTAQPYLLSTLYPDRKGEWEIFVEDYHKRDFYSTLAPNMDRKEAKKQVYTYVLFGENRICEGNDLWYNFGLWYPELAEIVWEMKKKDPVSVALALQSAEAKGMIGGVAGDLAEQKIPFITIHDGLLAKEQDAPTAKASIIKHFTALTGVEPRVTMK